MIKNGQMLLLFVTSHIILYAFYNKEKSLSYKLYEFYQNVSS